MKLIMDALAAQVTSETSYPTTLGEGPTTPTYPYVFVWGTAGQLEVNNLAGVRDLAERVGVTVVATTYAGVLLAAARVRTALTGFTPSATGWTVQTLREPYDSRPINKDRDVDLPGHGYPFFAVDLYRVYATRTTTT